MSHTSDTYYIGLCTTYHDPALAVVDAHGHVLFAEATERYLQYKRALNCEPDNPFLLPTLLKTHCPDARHFVVAGNWQLQRPFYERLAQTLGWLTPRGLLNYRGRELTASVPTWELNHMQACQHHANRRAGISLARALRKAYPAASVRFRHYDHHLAHAALACYGSPHQEAACAVIDSYGERGSMAFYDYRDGRLHRLFESRGPQSLGFLYMTLTELCGFDWMGGEEWKVMGLASYGKVDEEALGWLRNMMWVEGLNIRQDRTRFFTCLKRLESRRRRPDQPPEVAADLACTGQYFFVEIVNQLLSQLHGSHRSNNLNLAGGCALNSVCNGQLLGATPFASLYIPPAPADDGTALGAALLAQREDHPDSPIAPALLSPYLGSSVDPAAVERFATYSGLPVQHLPDGAIAPAAAALLSRGKILGWVQGRAEFGPRALGNRSILADPRSPEMGDTVNRVVKFRERFRPYAPSILHEHGPHYFQQYQESPYMDRTLRFSDEAKARVPAVVHTDGTGRLQSVKVEWNPRYHALLSEFHRLTSTPVLLNTSFNVMGKPIINSAEDAFGVFLGSGLDALALGDHLFTKPGVAL
ncbi:MAG: carbamoyltransferase [Methylococcaceae bacterium]|jgi:carbamoyltransferase